MTEVGSNRAYLGLGSNIEPQNNLPAAVRLLGNYGRVTAVSTVWETAPVGFLEQPNFLNAAALMITNLTAGELREQAIAEVERQLHRVRDPHNVNGPRTIDVDLLLYNRDVTRSGSHDIPDPQILKRPFLAVPLAEIDPEYVHPVTGQTLRQIAEDTQFSQEAMKQRCDLDLGSAFGA